MRLFSLAGIIFVGIYYAIIDRVLVWSQLFPYMSAVTMAGSVKSGGGGFDVQVGLVQALPILALSAFLVTLTPKFF